MKAICIAAPGDESALTYTEVPSPIPKDGEVLIQQEVIGVNFIDIYHRSGLYPLAMPAIIGIEGGGTIIEGGMSLPAGTPVVYSGQFQCYAERVVVPHGAVIPLHAVGAQSISMEVAVAVLTQGLTAHYLLHDIFVPTHRHTILVHAAAGGVGRLLCQWARRYGATVLATVGSEDKIEVALRAGAHQVIAYEHTDIVQWVREHQYTINAVFDSVGKSTLLASLEVLAPCGTLVTFGQSSGSPPDIPTKELAKKSIVFTRPSLFHYVTAENRIRRATELFQAVRAGVLDIHIDAVFPLSQAAEAHRVLASRKTVGKILLRP